MDIFTLFGRIAINNSGANDAIDETGSKANQLQSTIKRAFNKVGGYAVSCGKVVAHGLAVGTAAMGTAVGKAMGLAGELEQNLGGSVAVFGNFATKMQNIAKNAFYTMGLSESDFLATANKMGSLFQGAGFSAEESANMTAEAMKRAADVASIMGISMDSAMESIAGAAKGNFTMMDNLGVAINDTTLAQYALEKGIKKSTSAMTTQEKVGLAMELFMERTAQYAGNYAKENDTLAGSLNTAKAALSNFFSGTGDMDSLSMALTNASEVIIRNLNELLPKLTKGIGQMFTKLSPKIPVLLQAAMPGVIEGAVALLTGLAMVLPDMVDILAEQLPYIFEQLSVAAKKVFPLLGDTLVSLFEMIDFKAVGVTIGATFVDLVNRLPEMLQGIGQTISNVWNNAVWPLIQGIFKAVFQVELPDWSALVSEITNGWTGIVWPSIQNFFKQNFNITLPSWAVLVSDVSNGWNNVVQPGIKDFFKSGFKVELPSWPELVSTISNAWENVVLPAIANFFRVVFNVATEDSTGVGVGTRIRDWWDKALELIGNIFRSIFMIDTEDDDGATVAYRIEKWWDSVLAIIGDIFKGFFRIDLEDDATLAENIKAWWDAVCTLIGDIFFKLFEVRLPNADDVKTAINGWWNTLKAGLSLAFTANANVNYGTGSSIHSNGNGGGSKDEQWDNETPTMYHSQVDGVSSATIEQELEKSANPHAKGLDFVPRDNYLARLHYGETVLNKEAAEAWREQQTRGINLESLVEKLEEAMSSRPIAINIDGKAFATIMAKEMSKSIGNRNIQTLMGMGG